MVPVLIKCALNVVNLQLFTKMVALHVKLVGTQSVVDPNKLIMSKAVRYEQLFFVLSVFGLFVEFKNEFCDSRIAYGFQTV